MAILVGFVPSALTQSLVVDPSELEREAPFIQHNIDATRRAYGLDRIDIPCINRASFTGPINDRLRKIHANDPVRRLRLADRQTERPAEQAETDNGDGHGRRGKSEK